MNRKVALCTRLFSGLVWSAGALVTILVPLIITLIIRRHQLVETKVCFDEDSWLKYGFEKTELLNHLPFEYRDSSNKTQFCVKAFAALKLIAIKQLDLHYDTDINPEQTLFNLTVVNCTSSHEKPSLLHLKDIGTITTKDKSTIIFWKTLMKDGNVLQYNDKKGMIAIQKSGYYHIALQLTMMKYNASDAKRYEILKHMVIRISHTTQNESIILESATSPCELAVEQCEESSYMAAVFRLEENDRIYVAVSKQYDVVLEDRNQFLSIIEM